MLIKPLVMYNVYYFWNNFKNNSRALSGWFLTKHTLNKNTISLNPKISVLIYGCLLYYENKVFCPRTQHSAELVRAHNLPILSTKPVRSNSRLFTDDESPTDALLFMFLSLLKMISLTCWSSMGSCHLNKAHYKMSVMRN